MVFLAEGLVSSASEELDSDPPDGLNMEIGARWHCLKSPADRCVHVRALTHRSPEFRRARQGLRRDAARKQCWRDRKNASDPFGNIAVIVVQRSDHVANLHSAGIQKVLEPRNV